MASKEEIDGAPLDNEDEPQKVERRPSLSLSFHGIAKSPEPPSHSASPNKQFRALDRRLSLEYGMHQASALQTPSRKLSLSLGVPSPRDLSRRSSLEVPAQTPSKGESGLSSPNSAPDCVGSPGFSPRSPFSATLQRRNSLEVPFDRRLSVERRPSVDDFKVERQVSVDEAAAVLNESPLRRLSSSSLLGFPESGDVEAKAFSVPLARRDSRTSVGSSVSGSQDSIAHGEKRDSFEQPGRLSPSRISQKRPLSSSIDFTAFEAVQPETKRLNRSPSVPRVPSPLHTTTGNHSPVRRSSSDISLSRSSYPQIFADPELIARELGNTAMRNNTPSKPGSLSEPARSSLADSGSSESFNAELESGPSEPQPTPVAERKRSTSVSSARDGNASPTLHIVTRTSMDVGEYEARQRSPSTSSAVGSPRPVPERISVVTFDEESGATVTLNHDEDTVDVQLECPPVLRLSPAHRSSDGGDDLLTAGSTASNQSDFI